MEQLTEIRDIVVRVDEQVKAIRKDVTEIKEDHGPRIREIEKKQAKGRGIIIALLGVSAFLGGDKVFGFVQKLWHG
jgi:hypothetical protein